MKVTTVRTAPPPIEKVVIELSWSEASRILLQMMQLPSDVALFELRARLQEALA